jgi:hypothetical protein
MRAERFYTPESGERRRSYRAMLAHELAGRCLGGEPFTISIVDISREGFQGSTDQVLPLGMVVQLTLPNGRVHSARIVRVSDGTIAGQFLARLDVADISISTP